MLVVTRLLSATALGRLLLFVLVVSAAASAFLLPGGLSSSGASCLVSREAKRAAPKHTGRLSASSSVSSSSGGMAAGEGNELIKVVRNPDEATLSKLGVRQWPTWGCEASKFPWTYGDAETCYILEGEVTVTPTGGGGKGVTVGKGDLVTFAEGLSCTWDVHAAIRKHYKFH